MTRTAAPLLAVAFLLVALATSALAQQTLKPAAFTKEQLAAADKLIKQMFAAEYAKAKDDAGVRAQLANTLLSQAKEIKDDADVRYAALTEARALAAAAGDHETAFAAIAELAKHHATEEMALKIRSLDEALAATTELSRAKELAELALGMANAAGDEDRYAEAVKLAGIAEGAAKKSEREALIKAIAARHRVLQTAWKEARRVEPFLLRLKKDPGDAAAHLEVGKSWCFVYDKWERGLPHLAKGSDAALREIARADLGRPQKGDEQAKLAGRWQDAAQKEQGRARLQMLRRSWQWYQQAAAVLDGAAKNEVRGKITALAKLLPADLRVSDISTELRKLTGHTAEVLNIAFSPDGRHAVSCGADRTVRLWDVTDGKQVRSFEGHVGNVFGVAFSHDGKFLYSSGEDRSVRKWDVATGKVVGNLVGPADYLNSLALSPDGKLLAGGGQDRTVFLWAAGSDKLLRKLEGHRGAVFRVEFAPDGQTLASASDDQTIRLWDVKSGKELKELRGHSGQVLGLSFTPDGKKLLSCGEDRTIRLWDVASGKEERKYSGHTATVGSVAFAPDGLRFLSASDDRTLRLWDAATGEEVRQLQGHTDAVYRVLFSHDGRRALSCSLDKTIRLWGERR